MSAQLTRAQQRALFEWFDHERGLLMRKLNGRHHKTMKALTDAGLIAFLPVTGHSFSCNQLTLAGRAYLRNCGVLHGEP